MKGGEGEDEEVMRKSRIFFFSFLLSKQPKRPKANQTKYHEHTKYANKNLN